MECRHYILSKYLSAKRFAKTVRDHWSIENRLHWQLDVLLEQFVEAGQVEPVRFSGRTLYLFPDDPLVHHLPLTLIPYHGEPYRSPEEIYRGEPKSGTSHFHAYATAYVVREGRRFTVAMTRRQRKKEATRCSIGS